jgi:hypothetical protein
VPIQRKEVIPNFISPSPTSIQGTAVKPQFIQPGPSLSRQNAVKPVGTSVFRSLPSGVILPSEDFPNEDEDEATNVLYLPNEGSELRGSGEDDIEVDFLDKKSVVDQVPMKKVDKMSKKSVDIAKKVNRWLEGGSDLFPNGHDEEEATNIMFLPEEVPEAAMQKSDEEDFELILDDKKNANAYRRLNIGRSPLRSIGPGLIPEPGPESVDDEENADDVSSLLYLPSETPDEVSPLEAIQQSGPAITNLRNHFPNPNEAFWFLNGGHSKLVFPQNTHAPSPTSFFHNQPLYRTSPILSQPGYKNSPFSYQPPYQTNPFLDQTSQFLGKPAYQISPFLGRPVHQNSPFLDQKFYRTSPTLPVYRTSPFSNRPVYRTSPFSDGPVYRTSPYLDRPFLRTSPTRDQPVNAFLNYNYVRPPGERGPPSNILKLFSYPASANPNQALIYLP